MKTKLLSLLLALVLCMGLALPALASEEPESPAEEPAPIEDTSEAEAPEPAEDGESDPYRFATADELEQAIRDFESSGAKSRRIEYSGDGELVIDRTIVISPWLTADFGKASVTVEGGCNLQVHGTALMDGTMTVYGHLDFHEDGQMTVGKNGVLTIEGGLGLHEGALTVQGGLVMNGDGYAECFKGSRLVFDGGTFTGTGTLGARGTVDTPRGDYLVNVPTESMAIMIYSDGPFEWEVGYRPLDRSHEFRTMDELEALLKGEVPNDIDYVGETEFVFDRDVDIPAAVHFFNAKTIEIARGVTVTVNGYFGIGEATFTICGTLKGRAEPGVGAKQDPWTGELTHGALILAEGGRYESTGSIYFHDTDTTMAELVEGGWLRGFEKVPLVDYVEVWNDAPRTILQLADGPVFRSAEGLEEIIRDYNEAGLTWQRCWYTGGAPLVFEHDLDIPEGLEIHMDSAGDVTISTLAPKILDYFISHDLSFVLRDDGAPAGGLLDPEASYYRFRTVSLAGNLLSLECGWALRGAEGEDMRVALTLPERARLQEGSVTVNGERADYTFENGLLTVPVSGTAGALALSVLLLPGNTLQSVAELRVGQESERIGAVSTANDLLTLYAPGAVSTYYVAVSGHAPAGSRVTFVWADGQRAGETTASALGLYTAELSLSYAENGSELTLTASAKTADGRTLRAETSFGYDESVTLPYVTEFKMYYHLHELMKEIDLLATQGTCPAVYFDPGQPLAFVVSTDRNELIARYARLYVVSTKNGVSHRLPAVWDPARERFVASGFFTDDHDYVPGVLSVVVEYDRYGREIVTRDSTGGFEPGGDLFDDDICIIPPPNWLIDPSGYVYEAVPENRLEGVTATLYYRDEGGYTSSWEAWEYGQENSLTTDAGGWYGWDVPEGKWLVQFEKDGYETAFSDWLDVPPPQTEVNIGLVSRARPEVEYISIYEDGAELRFTQYMQIGSVGPDTVTLTADGQPVRFTVSPLDAAKTADGRAEYARSFRLSAAEPLSGAVNAEVSGAVNYAGLVMEFTFTAEQSVGPEISLAAEPAAAAACGETVTLRVQAEPAAAAAGKTVLVRLDNPYVAEGAPERLTLDETGAAELSLTAVLPGTVEIEYRLENASAAACAELTVRLAEPETAADAVPLLAGDRAAEAAALLRRLAGLPEA